MIVRPARWNGALLVVWLVACLGACAPKGQEAQSANDAGSDSGAVVTGDDEGRDSGMDAGEPRTPCGEHEHLVDGACVALPPVTTGDAGSDSGVNLTDDAGGSDAGTDASVHRALCKENEHVAGNACVACPPGTANEAGDDATGAETFCDPVLCGPNAHVVSHTCTACLPGLSRAAGDDASSADTECQLVLCALNEHVVSHACVACASSTNAAGDDPTGADTACDGTLCAAGFVVRNHACVACPASFDNPLVDDAAGADTDCTCITAWARPDADCGYCLQPDTVPYDDCSRTNNPPHLLVQDEDRDSLTVERGQGSYLPGFSIVDIDYTAQDYVLYAVHAELTGLPAVHFNVAAFTDAANGACHEALYVTPTEILFVCQFNVVNYALTALALEGPDTYASGTAMLTVTVYDNGWVGGIPQSDQMIIYANYF